MQTPLKANFKIYQGSTFKQIVRWESSERAYANITGITKAAPCVITAPGHGVPAGWRFIVTDVGGMKEINDPDTYLIANSVTTDTITVSGLNAASYSAYTTGGIITYNVPNNLSATARMQIREKITSSTILDELTTENGKIVIDNNAKTITLLINATSTAAYTFTSAVYSLEIILTATGEVVPLMSGNITLVPEITR